jgi:hypothetical protein
MEIAIGTDKGPAKWISPCGTIYGVDYHPFISNCDDFPELSKIHMDSNNTDDFMNKLFRLGWIRFRSYRYGVHINGCSLKKPHKRAHVQRILLYCLDKYENDRVNHETKVTLLNSQEGDYGPGYEPDPQYTVSKLLGGL